MNRRLPPAIFERSEMVSSWTIGPCVLVFDPQGEYSGLSNYAKSRIEALDVVWPTAEHLYQALKFKSKAHQERIRTAPSAAAAKGIAWGELTGHVRPDWDSFRVQAMEFTLEGKFRQNVGMRLLLRSSFPFPIAEDSEQDSFWGVGSGDGQNQLGRILELIRGDILGLPNSPVTVNPLTPLRRSRESRLAAVAGEYRIAPLLRTLPEDYLAKSALGLSIDELLSTQFGIESAWRPQADELLEDDAISRDAQTSNKRSTGDAANALALRARDRSEAFNQALATAFDAKYADYGWEGDARAAVPDWSGKFLDLLDRLMLDRGSSAVKGMVIGSGAGEEAANVWSRCRGKLTLVDIGPRMVENSARQVPGAISVRARAEELCSLPNNTYDFYCALRVYQSMYFDLEAAIEEAFRVLQSGGLFLVSISDAYLSSSGNIERGQIVGDCIDNTLALTLACRVANILSRLGFADIGFYDLKTELAVFARKSVSPWADLSR